MRNGGAICSVGGSAMSSFQGFIEHFNGALNITGKATFTNNQASKFGGAIVLSESRNMQFHKQ